MSHDVSFKGEEGRVNMCKTDPFSEMAQKENLVKTMETSSLSTYWLKGASAVA